MLISIILLMALLYTIVFIVRLDVKGLPVVRNICSQIPSTVLTTIIAVFKSIIILKLLAMSLLLVLS